jgi:hypothetical protein
VEPIFPARILTKADRVHGARGFRLRVIKRMGLAMLESPTTTWNCALSGLSTREMLRGAKFPCPTPAMVV